MADVLPQLAKLGGATLNLVFPRFCAGCGKEGDFLCASCHSSLHHITPPVCPLCGEPQPREGLCRNCTQWEADIDGIRSPFRFDGTIHQAIHQLKYNNLPAIAATLAGLMAEFLKEYPMEGDVLVPVPLHPKRLRERGYNQSALLAGHLGKLISLPVDETSLVRARHTVPQARTTSVQARRQNVTGGFDCIRDTIKGKMVIVIDDVSTSGATMNAALRL